MADGMTEEEARKLAQTMANVLLQGAMQHALIATLIERQILPPEAQDEIMARAAYAIRDNARGSPELARLALLALAELAGDDAPKS